jgi:hypothetical protein
VADVIAWVAIVIAALVIAGCSIAIVLGSGNEVSQRKDIAPKGVDVKFEPGKRDGNENEETKQPARDPSSRRRDDASGRTRD